MAHSDIYTYLFDVTGIDVESIGEEAVDRVVKARMVASGHKNINDYLLYLNGSTQECQALVNDVTVPETWFFRDSEPFKLLANYVTKTCPPASGKKIKILSVPCSSGEEPYSIAMALLSAGLSPGSFVIDAVDINTRVLSFAERGIYGKNSFRGGDLLFRDKYFNDTGAGYELVDEVKKSVKFHHGNILSPDFMQNAAPYNIIFCRNLLIYFNLETKEKAIKSLHRLLLSDGLLFLGHAETGRMVIGLFDSMRHPGAFAYQPIDSTRNSIEKSKMSDVNLAVPDFSAVEMFFPQPVMPHSVVQKILVDEKIDHALSIDEVQLLADRGDIKKAMQLCAVYIQENPLEADGYCLQGIIFLAQSESDKAQTAFKRAIYLDPAHYQSLVHLSVLAVERGDFQAVTNYRARIERVRERL